jgi:hypothetical protein
MEKVFCKMLAIEIFKKKFYSKSKNFLRAEKAVFERAQLFF